MKYDIEPPYTKFCKRKLDSKLWEFNTLVDYMRGIKLKVSIQ